LFSTGSFSFLYLSIDSSFTVQLIIKYRFFYFFYWGLFKVKRVQNCNDGKAAAFNRYASEIVEGVIPEPPRLNVGTLVVVIDDKSLKNKAIASWESFSHKSMAVV